MGDKMRRALLVGLVAFGVLIGAACQPAPAPTVTATPSTTKPACREVTTVTGKVTPATATKELTLETQPKPGGEWVGWKWFPNYEDGWRILQAKVNQTTGAYSFTYAAPNNISQATTRLRVHAAPLGKPEVTSASWYVTRPSGC